MKAIAPLLRILGLLALSAFGTTTSFAQATVRILPLGDSLTEGFSNSAGVPGAYRNKLYTLLTNAGYPIDYVGTHRDNNNPALVDTDHQGTGGLRIDEVQSGLNGWLSSVEDPDVVLLLIGTNDISQNYNLGTIQLRMANLITDIAVKRPFAKIIVSTLPLRTDDPSKDALEVAFNTALATTVGEQATLGRQVSLVDIRPAISSGDLTDGVHPTQAGYDKIADLWYPAITSIITPQGTTNPPAIARISSQSEGTQVKVTFNKPVQDSATELGNFSVNNGLSISQATLDTSKRSITLTTSPQSPGVMYTLSVTGIRDRTSSQNSIPAGTTALFTTSAQLNGSFENDLAGWTTTGNIELKSTSVYTASDGSKLVAFNSGQTAPNGILSQTIPTIPGQYYQLLFDAGVFSFNSNQQRLQVSATGSGSLLSETITISGSSDGTTKWVPQVHSFLANSNSTTLTFSDVSTTGINLDLVLDNIRLTPQFVRTLTLTSSPTTGVTIGLSPLDVNGSGTGTTGFPRSYVDGTTVLLTAPTSESGKTFIKWQKNGIDYSTSPSTSVLVDGSYTFNAVYGTGATPVSVLNNGSFESAFANWTTSGNLTLRSTSAATNGSTLAEFNGGNKTPNGVLSQTFGTIPGSSYTLTFDVGVISYITNQQRLKVDVTGSNSLLSQTIILSGQGGGITGWSAQSFTFLANSSTSTLTFTDTSATTDAIDLFLDDVEITGPPPQPQVLTVTSSPGTAVPVTIAPDDINGSGNGITQFTRTYGSGAIVTVTAPPKSGSLIFSKWQKNGTDLTENMATTVTMDSDLTISAIYVPEAVAPGTLVNGSFESGESGWTMNGNRLVYASDGNYIATEGGNMVVLNGGLTFPDATLSQSFATTPGQSYQIKYDIGILSINQAEQVLQLEITGSEILLSQSESLNGNGQGTSVWTTKTYNFTADSVLTTLTVRDASPTTVGADLLLDNVTVSPAGTPVIRTLNVESSPVTEVPITVSQADLNNNSDGVTAFTRSYLNGTTVELTAPAVSQGNEFLKWQKNGLDLSSSETVSVLLDSDRSLTAVYVPGSVTTELLINGSFESELLGWTSSGNIGPVSDSPYTASEGSNLLAFNGANTLPNGILSQSFATIAGNSYTLSFDIGALAFNNAEQKVQCKVSGLGDILTQILTVTPTGNGNQTWNAHSFTFIADSSLTTLSFTDISATSAGLDLTLDHVSVIGTPGTIIPRTLSVISSSGAAINVVVTDSSGIGNAQTPISRTYNDGDIVGLTAPATSGTQPFIKWQRNNVDFSTSATISVTMDSDTTLKAVYGSAPPAIVSLVNGSFESDFTGWTAAGNVFIQSAAPYTPTHGAKLAAFNAGNTAPNGVLSQTITTSPGVTYTLAFDVGALSFNNSQQAILVKATGTGDVLTKVITINGLSGATTWQPQSFTFVADSENTTLTFSDVSTNGTGLDLVLDHVRVTGPTVQHSLSVRSSPESGVEITVSPVDLNSNSHGPTELNRLYDDGALVTLTAPLVTGGTTFIKWQKNGVDFSNGPVANVIMDTEVSMTAVYIANLAPMAVADSYSTSQNTTLSVSAGGILLNDTDNESSPLTATLDSSPNHGSLVLSANGGFVYTPAPNFTGIDSFSYHANDGTFDSNVVTVSIDVNAVLATPFVNGSFENGEDGWTMSGNRLNYDSDGTYVASDGNKMMVLNGGNSEPNAVISQVIATTPGETYALSYDVGAVAGTNASQALQVNVDGASTLVSDLVSVPSNALGTPFWKSESYRFVADSTSTTLRFRDISSSSDFIDLLLDNVRVGVVRTLKVTSSPVTGLEILTSPNDLDGNGNGTTEYIRSHIDGTIVNLTAPALSNGNPFLKWQKNGADFGIDPSISIQMDSDLTLTAVYTSNTAPVANSDFYTVSYNGELVVNSATGILANDSDAESSALTTVLSAGPSNGVLDLSSDGSFIYTPALGFSGADSFTYRASDGILYSNVVTVSIHVSPRPVLSNGSFELGEDGWIMSGARIVYATDGSYHATDGSNLLVMNGGEGFPDAIISQSFPTVPGQSYELKYDIGCLALNNAEQTLLVSLEGNSILLSESDTLLGDGTGTSRWASRVRSFVADSTTTTLTFRDQSSATSLVDLLLDRVEIINAAATTRTLTVDSLPGDGVTISVSPVDLEENGGGVSQFTRSYSKDEVVTLTAPSTFGKDVFVKWQRNGADFSTTNSTSVMMDTSCTMTAIYQTPPPSLTSVVNGSFESGFAGWTTTGNTFIESELPYSATDGVKLASFNGGNSAPNGKLSQVISTTPGTTYTLAFSVGTLAYNTLQQRLQISITGEDTLLSQTVTVNGVGGGNPNWISQSFTFVANSLSTDLTFSDVSSTTGGVDLLLDDVRVSSAQSQRTLNVTSNTLSGITVAVSPSDSNSGGNGITQFTRIYDNGVTVNLTAPAFNESSEFVKWQKNGVDFSQSRATSVVMDSNHTMSAIYKSASASTGLVNGSFETELAGWTTAGGTANSVLSTSTLAGTDGTKVVAFNSGNSPAGGSLSQAFSTTPGTAYTVEFDVGILAYNQSEQRMQFTATGSGSILNQTLSMIGNGNGTVVWAGKSFSFIANSSTTTITFTDVSTTTIALDLLLDHVRVTAGAINVVTDAAGEFSNGSFEDGLTAWTRAGGTSDSIATGALLSATQGTSVAVFNSANSPTGASISQTFATIPGVTYIVNFDIGVLAYNSSEQRLLVTVAGSENLLSQSTSIFGGGGGTIRWEPRSYSFIASSTSTTLAFTDTSPTTLALDLLLDHVRVAVGEASSVAGTNVIANGSFETFFTNWSYSGSLRIEEPGAVSFPDFRTDGNNTLSFNVGGPNDGVISQSFATSIGTTYSIRFDQGVLGFNTSPQSLRTMVTGNGSLLNVTDTIIGRSDFVFVWTPRSYSFVANSTTTTLTFYDVSTTGNALDMYLDNVRVSAVPLASPLELGEEIASSLIQEPEADATGPSLGSASLTGSSLESRRIGMTAAEPGVYFLESSTDLKDWKYITETVVTVPGPIQFEDQEATQRGKFYRIGRRP